MLVAILRERFELFWIFDAVLDHIAGHGAARAFGEQADDFIVIAFLFLEHHIDDAGLQGFGLGGLEIFIGGQIYDDRVFVPLKLMIQFFGDAVAPKGINGFRRAWSLTCGPFQDGRAG